VGRIRVGKECKPLTGPELTRLLFSGGQRDLTAEAAAAAHEAMKAQLQYDLLFFLDGANRVAAPAQMQALSSEQRQQLHRQPKPRQQIRRPVRDV